MNEKADYIWNSILSMEMTPEEEYQLDLDLFTRMIKTKPKDLAHLARYGAKLDDVEAIYEANRQSRIDALIDLRTAKELGWTPDDFDGDEAERQAKCIKAKAVMSEAFNAHLEIFAAHENERHRGHRLTHWIKLGLPTA